MSTLMDALGPVALCLGVVVAAAALYFVVTLLRGRRRDRDEGGAHMR